MEPIHSEKGHQDGPIAMPVLRAHLWIAGTFADAPVRTAASRVAEAFMAHLGDAPALGAMVRPTGSKSLKLTRAGEAKRTEMSRAVATGLPDHRYLYLAGADDAGQAGHPMLALAHAPLPMAEIRIDLSWQAEGALDLMGRVDAALEGVPVLAGYMGYGFAPRPLAVNYASFAPPAHLRYRAALMMDPVPFSPLVRHDPSVVTMRRAEQKRAAKGRAVRDEDLFDYAPGLPDIGWRTYVGGPFRDRLPEDAAPPAPGLAIDDRGAFTTLTAGPAPTWGDLNMGEDIGPYQAAFARLEPAMADRDLRVQAAPGYSKKGKERVRQAEAYADRFKDAEGQARDGAAD